MDKVKTYEGIRKCLASRGYFSVRKFCLAHEMDYQNFLRSLRLGVLSLSEVEVLARKLDLTKDEIIEFFLPTVFENLKQINK